MLLKSVVQHNTNVFNQVSKLPTLFQIAVSYIPEKSKFCSNITRLLAFLNEFAQLDGKQRRLFIQF